VRDRSVMRIETMRADKKRWTLTSLAMIQAPFLCPLPQPRQNWALRNWEQVAGNNECGG
jgi:hypothetical protein